MVMGRRAKPEALFSIGQRVVITRDGERIRGKVHKFKDDGRVRVLLSQKDGGYLNAHREQVTAELCATEGCGRTPQPIYAYCDVCLGLNAHDLSDEPPEPEDDPEKKGGQEMGFVQYDIKWKARGGGKKPRYFTADTEDLHFYGWWRKTKTKSNQSDEEETTYAIDIFAKRAGHAYTIEPIHYATNPLKNLKSLEADIRAAMNKFMHQTVNGHAESLDTLQAKARFPIIKIKRLATIDSIILKLKEIRDTSIRAGGQRLVEIHGDNDDSPTIRVQLDLTTQALVMKGKIPDLVSGAMFDPRKKGERHEKLTVAPASGNVDDLVKQLKKAKEADDKPLARKIRAVLRKIGHKGGARSVEAKTKKKEKS